MKMVPFTSYNLIGKSAWPDGPWQTEPDCIMWYDETTNYPCLMLRHSSKGYWCGYVAVPAKSPVQKWDYNRLESEFDVHGGISFRGRHTNKIGVDPTLWWIGFSCDHSEDVEPGSDFAKRICQLPPDQWGGFEYRDAAFVKQQLQSLASQLYVKAFKPVHK